ncbi:hypothetical protein PGT21_024753 [Puccinia graminis f. sp. tritici]|uniref:Uncharacterized protein n=1 Tax=Puccinia graminis f. sp. tritici TaxID=56615 RepID=A0A5B0MFH2_PUCGR|nr:hypothetical protein PGT21_024753 [Puccinia graminis f. sp. tritici]
MLSPAVVIAFLFIPLVPGTDIITDATLDSYLLELIRFNLTRSTTSVSSQFSSFHLRLGPIVTFYHCCTVINLAGALSSSPFPLPIQTVLLLALPIFANNEPIYCLVASTVT